MEHTGTRPDSLSSASDVDSRLRAIRARLPGQMLHERLEMVQVCYGPLWSLADVRQRVAQTLPRRAGYVRSAVLEPIENYRQPIPDEALFKYDDASKTGYFSRFFVATPTYYQERQIDPWILAEVAGTDRYVVIAQWDA